MIEYFDSECKVLKRVVIGNYTVLRIKYPSNIKVLMYKGKGPKKFETGTCPIAGFNTNEWNRAVLCAKVLNSTDKTQI